MPITLASKRKSAYRGPDSKLVADQLAVLQAMWKKLGPEDFIKYTCWILRKEPEDVESKVYWATKNKRWNRRLVPFAYNKMQKEWEKNLDKNNFTLKYRQGGSTTVHVIRRLLLPAILVPGTAGLLISQTKIYGKQHFDILKRSFKYFGCVDPLNFTKNDLSISLHENLLHTEFKNTLELVFDQLDSRILVDTAENPEVGQGLPGISCLVATEVARWPGTPEDTMANVTESVTPGGTKDIESTANGMGGYFFEEYQRAKEGKSEYRAHFYSWPYAEEYTITDEQEQKEFITSFSELDEEEKRVVDLFKLDLAQVAWRRKSIQRLRQNFYEKYCEDDLSCFLTTGNSFFEKAIVRDRLLYLKANDPTVSTGANGNFKIFVRPNNKRSYILHADVALGRQIKQNETDYSYFTVIDEATGQQCARYRDKIAPEDYAYYIKDAAEYYNNALVSIERNPGGGGDSVLLMLKQLEYPNIYQHKDWDKENQVTYTPGFPVTIRTRPIALNRLAYFVRTEPYLFNDLTLMEECLTFVRDPKKGSPAAQVGCHDDAVLSSAGACTVRLIRLGYIDITQLRSEKYGEDIIQ